MLVKLSATILGTICFVIASVLVWILWHHANYIWTINTIVLIPCGAMLYLLMAATAFRLGNDAPLNMCILTAAAVIALYLAEFMLIVAGPHITLPAEFDRRDKLQVVLDLRKDGQGAIPSTHPKNIMPGSLNVQGKDILPLGGIPNSLTVFCNETGSYYIYDADEYGFVNPKGMFSATNSKIALIGDSFTQGFCAHSGTSYAELIRESEPKTLNLGNNGNGPLLELAGIREFVLPLKPKYVFWFYFEGNDLEDLSRELAHPILRRYLEDATFSQHLTENVEGYEKALRNFVEDEISRETNRSAWAKYKATLPEKVRLWSQLWHLRALTNITDIKHGWTFRKWNVESSEADVAVALDQILHQAKNEVESWNGEFIFVYLPSYRTYKYRTPHPWRPKVDDILRKYNIRSIDIAKRFAEHPDTVSLFNYRKEGHYTTEGNAIVGNEVLKLINEEQTDLPLNNTHIEDRRGGEVQGRFQQKFNTENAGVIGE